MKFTDRIGFCVHSLGKQRVRSFLIVLAMAIGTAGVVLLTWLGDSARHYVIGQFSSLGTNLVIVFPGRNETTGGMPPILGETARDLTLDDSRALLRSPAVARLAPVVIGGTMVGRGNMPIISGMFSQASQQIMTIHVGGTLDNPETYTEAFPVASQALERLRPDSGDAPATTAAPSGAIKR